MIKIKELKYSQKNKQLWYWNFQGETFHKVFDTKNGYLVKREDDSKMYLVKRSHSIIIDNDIV